MLCQKRARSWRRWCEEEVEDLQVNVKFLEPLSMLVVKIDNYAHRAINRASDRVQPKMGNCAAL